MTERLSTAEPPSTVCTCSALRQAARHATRMYDDALTPVGLGLNQYAILANVERSGPKNLRELAERLVMDRSTLGHLLRPLQARDLLTIEASSGDKRRRVIALTPTGTALMEQARPYWARAQRRFEQSFGFEDDARLRDALARVTAIEFSVVEFSAIDEATARETRP